MELSSLNLETITLTDLVQWYNQGLLHFSTKDKKTLLKLLSENIASENYTLALNTSCLAFLSDKEIAFKTAKAKGLFRYSKFFDRNCHICEIAKELIRILEKTIGLTLPESRYLHSLIILEYIYKHSCTSYSFIIAGITNFISQYKCSPLKTLIAYAELAFINNHQAENKENLQSITGRSKEEIAYACSYIIHILSEQTQLTTRDALLIFPEFFKGDEIEHLILNACYLDDFKEIEIKIENLGYYLEAGDDKFILQPPLLNFEKVMRMGYIRNELQITTDTMLLIEQDFFQNAVSIEKLADLLSEKKDLPLLQRVETGNYPRYVLALPDFALELISDKMYNKDSLFQEELAHLHMVLKEQLMNLELFKTKVITGSLTLMEFLKIRRFFSLLYQIFLIELRKLPEDTEEDDVLRSLAPSIRIEDFQGMLADTISMEKVKEFLSLLAWSPGDQGLFDIQYQPIISTGGNYIIPLSIFSSANFIRNLYASQYKKQNRNLLMDGTFDPISANLKKVFDEKGIPAMESLKIPDTDIDVIAVLENALILIECKQSLLPTGVHEFRTIYDYIKKAQQQLDKAVDCFRQGHLIQIAEAAFGLNLSHIEEVVTIVITSSRMLAGNLFTHPVRNVHELKNMIRGGIMRTNSGNFCMWQSEEFNLNELKYYLSADNKIQNHMLNSLTPVSMMHKNWSPPLEYITYALEVEEATKSLDSFTTENLRKV